MFEHVNVDLPKLKRKNIDGVRFYTVEVTEVIDTIG